MKNTNNIINLSDFSEDCYGFYQGLSIRLEESFERQIKCFHLYKPLSEAVDYAMFPAGKRIRPFLSCLLAADLAVEVNPLIDISLSLELLHCASLVHDDLPALDDDDMRRGKPSMHKAFSEATAILTGDILVPMAFSVVSRSDYSNARKTAFTSVLADAYVALCCGQQLDILPVEQRGDLETIHHLKTGALFSASCQFAAIATGLKQDKFAILGQQIGALFQLIDDLLDAFGTFEDKGRNTRSDLKNNKLTMASEGNLEFYNRKLNKVKNSIDSILIEIAKDNGIAPTFPKTRFLLQDLYEKADCNKSSI